MQGDSPPHYHHEDYGQAAGSQHDSYSNRIGHFSRDEAAELQNCHRTIADLEARCSCMERETSEREDRLEKKQERFFAAEFEAKKNNDLYVDRIHKYVQKENELAAMIRTKDRQLQRMEEKQIENKEDLRRVLQKKHEIVAQAKREVRQNIRDQERAARDNRNMSSSNYGPPNVEPRGDPVRRTPSAGTLFAKGHSVGGRYGVVVAGIAVGGRLGGTGDRPTSVPPEPVRKPYTEKTMSDFFQM